MSTDREILQALASNTPPTIINQPKINMPKMLLEDEVQKVKPAKYKEQINESNTLPNTSSNTTFNLEAIFNKDFLAKLTPEDLDKPLKDIILGTTTQAPAPTPAPKWEYYEQHKEYVCEFEFSSKENLSLFVSNVFPLVNSIYNLESPNSIELYVTELNKENLEAINTIYQELVKKKVKPDIELDYRDLNLPLSYEGEIIQRFESGKDYILKIPVAKIGKWKHPIYEEVSFTSKDLDDILSNFNNKELGFEPPVYFGHSMGDGTPAQGYLQRLERESDVLFGYWAVNKEAYRLVEDEVYRYSSAEIILNLTSKKTGDKIGKAIFGMALTNIPFVPDLPKTQALEHASISNDIVFLSFSNKEIDKVNLENKESKKMEQQPMNQMELALKEQVEAYAAKVKELELTRQELEQSNKLSELKAQLEQYSQKEEKFKETEQKLSTVVEQNKQLADKLEQYEQSIRDKEVETKVAKLETLPLPTEFKQVYSNLIKEGKLGEVEGIVLSSLESLANSYTNQLLEQTGTTEETTNLNNQDYEDPYQLEIDRCKRLIEQRIR